MIAFDNRPTPLRAQTAAAEEVLDYIRFATATEQAGSISCGPARRSSDAFAGRFDDDATDMAPQVPPNGESLRIAAMDEPEFRADHGAQHTGRLAIRPAH